jgi:hypothetical protein
MVRQSKYTLLIICEGKNTEPYFFHSIRDRILSGKYLNEDLEIHIRPEVEEEDKIEFKNSEYKPQRKLRPLLKGNRPVKDEIPGVPPLKWVVAAHEELNDGTFNEVWVVFDNDGHPAKQEAFELAQKTINGKQVQVAYTSIAFEYYLLLHFERKYYAFQKSECRKGKVPINCYLNDHPDDCSGVLCIGGYARRQGYWMGSKEKKSLFPLIENKLEIGFWNAAWLRYQSDIQDRETPFYNRNPYVTTDTIVKRLTGFQHHHFEFIPVNKNYDIKGIILVCFQKDHTLKITNTSKNTLIIPPGSIKKILCTNGAREHVGSRAIVKPGESINITIAISEDEFKTAEFSFNYDNYHLMPGF